MPDQPLKEFIHSEESQRIRDFNIALTKLVMGDKEAEKLERETCACCGAFHCAHNGTCE
jgi:hypothetical protein